MGMDFEKHSSTWAVQFLCFCVLHQLNFPNLFVSDMKVTDVFIVIFLSNKLF